MQHILQAEIIYPAIYHYSLIWGQVFFFLYEPLLKKSLLMTNEALSITVIQINNSTNYDILLVLF